MNRMVSFHRKIRWSCLKVANNSSIMNKDAGDQRPFCKLWGSATNQKFVALEIAVSHVAIYKIIQTNDCNETLINRTFDYL